MWNIQDIILMGYFNKTIGDAPQILAQVIAVGRLIDVHAHKRWHENNVVAYI